MLKNLRLPLLLLIFIFPFLLKGQGHLVEAFKFLTVPKESLNFLPGISPQYDVDLYYISYHTTDAHGQTVLASGAFMLPVTDSCNYFPLLSFQHGTVLKKNDVPSRNNSEALVGQVFASLGYIACMPDYQGMGDGPGRHPYLHAQTQADATIDIMRACREYINDSLGIFDNGQIFLAGYSQGGHATMAAHKKIEEANLLQEFDIVAASPGAGPYHLSGAQSEMVFLMPDYSRPGYIVYLLYSYNDAYQNLFNNPSEIFKAPYDSLLPIYMNGNYSMTQLNNILPDSLHKFLQDTVYQAILYDFDDKTLPFWQNLLHNDNHDWTPQRPLRMYYCEADEQVSYLNAINALQAMQNNGAAQATAISLNPTANHSGCANYYIYATVLWFNSLMTPCVAPASIENLASKVFSLSPNPVTNFIQISGLNMAEEIKIYNIHGQLQQSLGEAVSESFLIDVSALGRGVYLLTAQNKNGHKHSKRFVKL